MSRIQRGRFILFQKDALASSLTLIAPPPSPLHKRRLPLPIGSGPAKGRLPLLAVGLTWAVAPCGRPKVSRPCGHRAISDYARGRLPPLRVGLGSIQPPPCRGPWPQSAIPAAGLAIVGCPYSRLGRGWLPMQGAWPWPVTSARGLVVACHPCREREENRRGRLMLQPINHESPLLFIESYQKTLGLLP
ncbi:hypothetical protein B296_00011396 [Ensete ventricosum]|uniref:Uncharacterized protein n=1 Tax=Ensete ventricosum TaxID=4639 RepID=A0A426ZSI5_ENSVE|nr:hypothetical protein B296_00011396 [Ensete ventricosum]